MDKNSSSDYVAISDPSTGMYRGSVVSLKRGQWYALVVERGFLQSENPHITFTNEATTVLPINADKLRLAVGGSSSFDFRPRIYYSIIEIKGPDDLKEFGEHLEIAQIFQAGDVKKVTKFYKKKKEIISNDVQVFKGYKLDGKKKVKKLKKKRKKK